jgi:ABC-type branched-subunit amino acid transport system substrate-binding protein
MNTPKGYEKVKKLLIYVFVLAMTVSLIGASLVGCSGSTTASNEQTITIGVDTPLTGGAAPWGLSEMHGVTLAVEDFNKAGGLTIGSTHYTFKVEALDDKYDTALTTNNIRQMAYTDNIKFMFTFQTEGSVALASTLTKLQILNFTVVNDDKIIAQPANSYSYRTYMGFSVQANDYVKWMKTTYPKAKNIVVMTTNDTNGNVTEGYTKTAAAAAGFTYLAPVLYDPGTTDLTPFVTRVLAESPDIILTIGAPTGDVGSIAKILYGQGYKGIHATGIVGAADLLPIAGQAAIEGMLTLNLPLISGSQISDAVLGLPAREDAKWGAHYCCTWDFYSEAMIMLDAMKQAKSVDPAVVKAKIDSPGAKFTYAAIKNGQATFGSAASNAVFGTAVGLHQVTNSWAISIIKGGKDTIGTIINPK